MNSLIKIADFQKFSNVYPEANDNTQTNCLDMAQKIIEDYLGYALSAYNTTMPIVITQTLFRIASLLQQEGAGNIGINNKSFGDSGSRSFLNIVDYSKYLAQLSEYKLYYVLNETAKEAN